MFARTTRVLYLEKRGEGKPGTGRRLLRKILYWVPEMYESMTFSLRSRDNMEVYLLPVILTIVDDFDSSSKYTQVERFI